MAKTEIGLCGMKEQIKMEEKLSSIVMRVLLIYLFLISCATSYTGDLGNYILKATVLKKNSNHVSHLE